jgi:hypothetical protein
LVIPGGGLDTLGRLELIESTGVTAIFCTPSYALHMLEVAQQNQWDAASLDVSRIIVAGEPGGSVPSIRQRLESGWNARVIDHAGATEIGPWGYADPSGRGLHIVESEFIAEFLAVETGDPATEGELAELVLTVLNRPGAPAGQILTSISITGHFDQHARRPPSPTPRRWTGRTAWSPWRSPPRSGSTPDHGRRRGVLVREPQQLGQQVRDREDQHGLDEQRNGDPQDRQRVGDDRLALQAEQQHQRPQQGDDRHRRQHVQELGLEPRRPLAAMIHLREKYPATSGSAT